MSPMMATKSAEPTIDQTTGKAVEDPFDPIGTEAEASKLLIRRPYEPRF